MSAVHAVVPDGIDDPARPSGGNTYDRRVCQGLAARGWSVDVHAVPGSWPQPDAGAYAALAAAVGRIPDGAVVLLDGLVASTAPEVLVPHANRLRLVALVHMPLGHGSADDGILGREGAVLSAAASVVTTSAWARRRLVELYSLPDERLHVAEPGVDARRAGTGNLDRRSAPLRGRGDPRQGARRAARRARHDDRAPWHCRCVGSLDRDATFAERLRRRVGRRGLGGRVSFPGPGTGPDLDRSYAGADLLVLASRSETYGMVVTEALARGLPVVAADVGGVPEALGRGAGGARPGRLVPPDDPIALGDALRAWLRDAELRRTWRRAARERRAALAPWSTTTSVLAAVLAGAAR